nr:immunoglobulin heavy chain junction region [Mus musculus]
CARGGYYGYYFDYW